MLTTTPPASGSMIRCLKISKNRSEQHLNHFNLTDIYRALCFKTKEHIISSRHGTFTKIDLVSGHERSCNKCKRNDIIHSVTKFEITNNKISRKTPNI